MNKTLIILLISLLSLGCTKKSSVLHSGDLIFQTSLSSQSKALQLATKSKYSHMGIIYKSGDKYYVYEAIQPVQLTELNRWISRGQDSHYVVKRLKNYDSIISSEVLKKMKSTGEQYSGKDYDKYFEWSDDRIYCSELVWKIFKEVLDIEIGQLQKMSDLDLSHPLVRQQIKERYGDNFPSNELVISPAQMFNSDLLITVYSN